MLQRNLTLPPDIQAFLAAFVARRRRQLILHTFGWAIAVSLLWLILSCSIDRLLHLPASARLILLALGVLVLLLALRPLRFLLQPIDWVEIAEQIERLHPSFQQRLITVTSRVLGESAYRGSNEILGQLLSEVSNQTAKERGKTPRRWRAAIEPWAAATVMACGMMLLALSPGMDLPRLTGRFFKPLASLPPVTTTRLDVRPGDLDVNSAEPVKIQVNVQHLGASSVWLHLEQPAGWSRSTMNSDAEGRYSLTLSSVDQDLHYFVNAGDATSRQYLLRVRRMPAVAQFRIRYSYPSYTGRAPFTITNGTGLIEAPVGSEARVTVTATERLSSATLSISGSAIAMEHTDQPNTFQAKLVVQKSQPYTLDLLSDRGVHGSGPESAKIVAMIDRPPLVRLQQANQSLRLSAGDIVPLAFQGVDDFGIDSMRIRAQINDAAPAYFPLTVVGDRRRQEDVMNFDLARMKLALGDVVTIWFDAQDGAGHLSSSDPLQVVISPRSIDLDTQARIDELNGAAQLASTLRAELEEAGAAVDQADAQSDHQSTGYLSAEAQGNRHLASASEIATMVRQSLLRAILHSPSAVMSVALSDWVDTAQSISNGSEDLFRLGGAPSGMGNIPRDRLTALVESSRELQKWIQTSAQGERSAAVIADRENLAAARARPAPANPRAAERRSQGIARMSDEIAAGAIEAGIDPTSRDLDAKLHVRLNAEQSLIDQAKPVDFAIAAQSWAGALREDPHRHPGLDLRLSAAAQAEAVRPDADLVRAHDLESASRAAAALETVVSTDPKASPPSTLSSFADAITAIEREHALSLAPANIQHSSDAKAIHEAAGKARRQIALWGGDPLPTTMPAKMASTPQQRAVAAEELALQSSAEASHRNYQHVTDLDNALIHQLIENARDSEARGIQRTRPGASNPQGNSAMQHIDDRIDHIQRAGQSIARSMVTAESVDHLGDDQEELENQALSTSGQAQSLADRQRSVADAIARVQSGQDQESSQPPETRPSEDDADWREKAVAAIVTTQEDLSAMPQALATLQGAVAAKRDADTRATAAETGIDSLPGEDQPIAQRAADQAKQDAKEASARVERALAPLSVESGTAMTDRLDPFVPDDAGAREVIRQLMLPALGTLENASGRGDVAAVDRAASDVRQAIEAAQRELAVAQDHIMQRDPLTAARWYASAAADSLSQVPADLKTAVAHQANVTVALSRAWDRSIHRAAAQRMALIPSMQSVYGPPAPAVQQTPTVSAPSPANFTAARQWGGLHVGQADALNGPFSNPDPPGYEESLRLYFEAIEKAQQQPGKTQ